MTTEPQTNDSENTPSSSEESLEQLEQHTAAVMDDARQKVDRARATLHDEILSTMQGSEVTDTEPEAEPEADEVDSETKESGPDKDDTRGAWPNWS